MGQEAFPNQRAEDASASVAVAGDELAPERASSAAETAARDRILDHIAGLVGEIDRRVHQQIEAVLHHPRFQRLEASWRGLAYLVGQVAPGDNVLVRILNVRWGELRRDFQAATEFDDSTLFRLFYDGELAMPGGRPVGVLLGDFRVCHKMSGHGSMGEGDLQTLEHIASLCGACFMPFVTAAHPSLLGLNDFLSLELPLRLAEDMKGPQYIAWRSFRQRDDARFVSVLLPQVLMRKPYADEGVSDPHPWFHERTNSPQGKDLLWGSPIYPFGAVLIRSFRETGLFFDISGMRLSESEAHAGLVDDLPRMYSALDADGAWPLPAVEVSITDRSERELASIGLTVLSSMPYTGTAVFYSDSALYDPYQESVSSLANAQLGARIRYMLSVSRLAHSLYVMGRSMVGSFTDEGEIQQRLNDWLVQYTSVTDRPDAATRARYPFRDATVEVSESAQIGRYLCSIRLMPHPEVDGVSGVLELSTQLRSPEA